MADLNKIVLNDTTYDIQDSRLASATHLSPTDINEALGYLPRAGLYLHHIVLTNLESSFTDYDFITFSLLTKSSTPITSISELNWEISTKSIYTSAEPESDWTYRSDVPDRYFYGGSFRLLPANGHVSLPDNASMNVIGLAVYSTHGNFMLYVYGNEVGCAYRPTLTTATAWTNLYTGDLIGKYISDCYVTDAVKTFN